MRFCRARLHAADGATILRCYILIGNAQKTLRKEAEATRSVIEESHAGGDKAALLAAARRAAARRQLRLSRAASRRHATSIGRVHARH